MHRSFSSSTSDGEQPSAFPAHNTDSSAFGSHRKHGNGQQYLKRPLSKDSSSNLSSGSLLVVLPAATYVNSDSPKECLSPLPSTTSHTGSIRKKTIAPCSTQLPSYSVKNEDNYLERFSREDLIRVIALYFDKQTRGDLSTPHSSNPLSVFFSVSPPQISILGYVRRIITHTHCSPSAFIVALIYLERIAQRHDALTLSHVNLHRLFITAVTLAVKKLDDRTFPIAHYAKVGAVPSREEMIRLEVAFMRFVDFDLHVTYPPYAEIMNRMNTLLAVVRENNTAVLGMSLTTSSLIRVKRSVNRTSTILQSSQSEQSAMVPTSNHSSGNDVRECRISGSNGSPQRPRSPSGSSLASSGRKRRKVASNNNREESQHSDDRNFHAGGPTVDSYTFSTKRIKRT